MTVFIQWVGTGNKKEGFSVTRKPLPKTVLLQGYIKRPLGSETSSYELIVVCSNSCFVIVCNYETTR